MTVRISLDEYGVLNANDFDLVISKNSLSIRASRNRIVTFLGSNLSNELLVLVRSQAVINKLSDLLSLKNVAPIKIISPTTIFESQLGFTPPKWLNNQFISKLNLLNSSLNNIREEFFLADLLREIEFLILEVKNFKDFIFTITRNINSFEACLEVNVFRDNLLNILILELKQDMEASNAFILLLEKSTDIRKDLEFISEQQALSYLKNISAVQYFPSAFPPLELPESLTLLPLINYYSKNTIIIKKYTEFLTDIFSAPKNDCNIELAIKLIIYPWQELIDSLEQIIKRNPKLISVELIEHLLQLKSKPSDDLANKLLAISKLSSLKPIQKNEEVQKVVNWSYSYLELIKQSFESNNFDYETELATSFSEWLIDQKTRVERSKFDWRHVSQGIEDSLASNDITVVFMVDALSQIHNATLREAFNSFENLEYCENIVFSPLPTLTKIGKKSVLTGFNPQSTSRNDYETILSRYKEFITSEQSFIFLQDWKRAKNNQLKNETKLVVVYINELDDRLHKTPSFSKHNDDAKKIIISVKRTIDKWLKDSYALKKNISFFITADHGVTSLNSTVKNTFEDKCGERVIELSKPLTNLPSNLYFLPGYNNSGYLVPKERASFERPVALSHGGITPEEVLIPFIQLRSNSYSTNKSPFSITLNNITCILESEKQWILKVPLVAHEDLEDILIKSHSPFYGNEKIKQLNKLESVLVPLQLSSKHGQRGMTEIKLTVQYIHNNNRLEKEITLDVDIPLPLLKETESSKDFGAMFDL